MLVKCLKDSSTPTHTLKKGEFYKLQSKEALRLIALKVCKLPTAKEAKALNDVD